MRLLGSAIVVPFLNVRKVGKWHSMFAEATNLLLSFTNKYQEGTSNTKYRELRVYLINHAERCLRKYQFFNTPFFKTLYGKESSFYSSLIPSILLEPLNNSIKL